MSDLELQCQQPWAVEEKKNILNSTVRSSDGSGKISSYILCGATSVVLLSNVL